MRTKERAGVAAGSGPISRQPGEVHSAALFGVFRCLDRPSTRTRKNGRALHRCISQVNLSCRQRLPVSMGISQGSCGPIQAGRDLARHGVQLRSVLGVHAQWLLGTLWNRNVRGLRKNGRSPERGSCICREYSGRAISSRIFRCYHVLRCTRALIRATSCNGASQRMAEARGNFLRLGT